MGVSTDCTWKKKTLDMSVLAVLFAPAMKRKSIGGINLFCYLFFFPKLCEIEGLHKHGSPN